jgi:hypothetical protein
MSLDEIATAQEVEVLKNHWIKHNARTGKHETFMHYILSQMYPECRQKFVESGEEHLSRRSPLSLQQYHKQQTDDRYFAESYVQPRRRRIGWGQE